MSELNPKLAADVERTILANIDWSQAPAGAAGYIAVCVQLTSTVDDCGDPQVHGCWLMQNGVTRIQAPNFGILELRPGQSFIAMRPGSEWTPIVEAWLRDRFWFITGLNDRLILEPPDPSYRKPDRIDPHQLSWGISKALAVEATVSRVRQKRVHLETLREEQHA